MAPTPIELALSTLLPTISFLPPELINLATSLLAQSRSKAGSLKPDEEIGRSYACAHIACERLARQLDLEVGVARPPVKPSVYGKLKGYLEGVLVGEDQRGGRRGAGRGSTANTPTASQNATPRKEVKTPTSAVKRGPALPATTETTTTSDGQKEVPEFVMPMIRAICKSCKKPAAVPHINVGVRAVVEEIVSRNVKRAQDSAGGEPAAKRRRRTPQSGKNRVESSPAAVVVTPAEAITLGKWPALLVALFVFTAKKMDGEGKGGEGVELREKATAAVRNFCEDGRRVLPEEVKALEGLEGSIKFYMLEAEDCGWLEMEWFQNVPEGVGEEEREGDGSDDEGKESAEDEGPVTPRRRPVKTPLRRKEKRGGKRAGGVLDEEVGAAGLFAGLGTMFQPAIDWLSEERRADYAQWKKEMVREIAAVEQKA